jgi:hypothetical protein
VARITPYSEGDGASSRRDALARLEEIRLSVKGTVNIRQLINEGRKR